VEQQEMSMTPEQIKQIRQKLNLTQKEFARLIGCPVATLQSWEQDKRKPGRFTVKFLHELIK
jgi:putative transcriptional regulator